MGIRYLNKFLREEAGNNNAIKLIHFRQLSGKRIAVDYNIYMYKFAGDNALIENTYLMLLLFRKYGITPVFIFDGKPPEEKMQLLQKRKADKKSAEKEYKQLQDILNTNKDMDELEKQEIINNMDLLKKQFIYISREKIDDVKELMRAYGATYYDAPGEADELCASLVIKGIVYACLSEDMDMFVYGCNKVIRYISLLNHTVVLYDMKLILQNLGITQKELREICVISGTDYNMIINEENNTPKLYRTLKLFKKYYKERDSIMNIDFYEWLVKKTTYIEDYDLLKKIYEIFEIKNKDKLKIFNNIKIINGPIMKEQLQSILEDDNFIFPEKFC